MRVKKQEKADEVTGALSSNASWGAQNHWAFDLAEKNFWPLLKLASHFRNWPRGQCRNRLANFNKGQKIFLVRSKAQWFWAPQLPLLLTAPVTLSAFSFFFILIPEENISSFPHRSFQRPQAFFSSHFSPCANVLTPSHRVSSFSHRVSTHLLFLHVSTGLSSHPSGTGTLEFLAPCSLL